MEPRASVTSFKDIPVRRWSLRSSCSLPYGSFANSLASLAPDAEEKPAISPKRAYVTMFVLCYVNLLNYMERYTIAGVLTDIQKFFDIKDSTAGLLQTVFICSFLLLAPLFGYLGDRYNRKYIMIGGLSVWLLTATASSFVNESQFWLLALLRGLVGTGEASYSTVAPTIISDLFTGGKRSIMICIFYIFIPVGSGLGYITGRGFASLTGDWHWALRVRTFFLFTMQKCDLIQKGVTEQSSYLEDVKYLLKNKSYVWSSLGVTALAFLTGALAFWLPNFLSRARVYQKLSDKPGDSSDSYIFGAVTVATGILGGALGTSLSRRFRDKVPNADPLICAVGMLGSVPCLFITIFVASASIPATYVFIFLGELLLSLNWAVLADILLYVVVPTRRATAEALQITVGHLLGDAGSPYLLGVISDAIYPGSPDRNFDSLKYSLLLCPVVGIVGGVFFVVTAVYIAEDRKAVQQLSCPHTVTNTSPSSAHMLQ
uniref:Major facilitator superfamily (MFS) profile domain-containing protein n=1 Tax=Astatotilapia calliptera TaxID=8154 RepID=A0AAX7SXX9_ASTCA